MSAFRFAPPLRSLPCVLPLLLLVVAGPAPAQEIFSGAKITVERVIVDARVTAANGEPMLGLTVSDFRVKIDGKPAQVESVEWIPETAATRELADVEKPPVQVNTSLDVPAPRGRLLIFLFQTDFARNAVRIGGQMKVLTTGNELLESLEPEDRVAVLSFDSHLKFRLDFSDDKRRIADAMEGALLIDEPPPPPVVPMPSLASRLDRQAMKDAASSERALLLIGNALRPIPGPKSLILFGWGLGRFSREGVSMTYDYGPARRALESARVSVFSLDITQADGHSLAAGLEKAADDTGGFYASMYHFPKLALQRLQRTLSGHYELEVRKAESKVAGVHAIEVQVAKRGAVIMARTSYIDKE